MLFKLIKLFGIILLATGICIKANALSNNKGICYNGITTQPKYYQTFTLPKLTNDSTYLVTRFYEGWGDGSINGWQDLIAPPYVTLNGLPLMSFIGFAYADASSYSKGSVGLGSDQYAEYWVTMVPPTDESGQQLIIEGNFSQMAYMSFTLYGTTDSGTKWQQEKVDYQVSVSESECNPYKFLHPSVFAYSSESPLVALKRASQFNVLDGRINLQKMQAKLPIKKDNTNIDKLGVYRLDKLTSKYAIADDVAADGCSQSYLFAAPNSSKQDVFMLRVKLPNTFIDSNNPDKIFGNYQVRYFSISSNIFSFNGQVNPLDFWTANSRLMKRYVDKHGYAYVFFAPDEYVHQVAQQQGLESSTQAPVVKWGNYAGLLLGKPDIIIMRYKVPSSLWQGSPINAKCYDSPSQLKPVTKEELGEYTPEIYADSFSNFLTGKIGQVYNNLDWPNK